MKEIINQAKTNWIQILLALISAGFIADYFGLIKFNSELSSADKTLLIEELRNDRNYYQLLYKECQESVNQINKDVVFLRSNLQTLSAVKNDLPVPVWLKDNNGKMLFVNSEYERLFLFPINKTKADYIGKYDSDIWPKETAEEYRANDIKAMQSNGPLYTVEQIPMVGTLRKSLQVIKYVQRKEGSIIGIGGVGMFIN